MFLRDLKRWVVAAPSASGVSDIFGLHVLGSYEKKADAEAHLKQLHTSFRTAWSEARLLDGRTLIVRLWEPRTCECGAPINDVELPDCTNCYWRKEEHRKLLAKAGASHG